MRSLEVIETELAEAREALSQVKGTPAEVYSRIVGYYRSVRNWNRGKREEYGERVMFRPDAGLLNAAGQSASAAPPETADGGVEAPSAGQSASRQAASRILLFVRPACPSCPSAKTAVNKLGIPVDLYDADTDEGLAEAVKRNVLSTPTAILVSSTGEEIGRARAVEEIGRLNAVNNQPMAV